MAKTVNPLITIMNQLADSTLMLAIGTEIAAAASKAVDKHGEQSHLPMGCGPSGSVLDDLDDFCRRSLDSLENLDLEFIARKRCEASAQAGTLTWEEILTEEYGELLAALTPAEQRKEALDMAAVLVLMIRKIDLEATEK